MSGSALLLMGIGLMLLAQLAVAVHASRISLLRGAMCVFVPLYVYAHANRAGSSPWFMRLWYLGVALFTAGGIVLS